MINSKYTKEFLISELQRFVEKNEKVPICSDMCGNYPSHTVYKNYFGSWNSALCISGLSLNQIKRKLNGNEICDKCGKNKPKNQNWYYKNNKRLCSSCYSEPDYKNGNLDKNSNVGRGFIGQVVVRKVLNVDLEHDCNCSQGFGSSYDLYDKKYGKMDVKTAKLNKNNIWIFHFAYKKIANSYICLGFDKDRKHILKVWIIPNKGIYKDLNSCIIINTKYSLDKYKEFEVDAEPYDDILHELSQKRKETNGESCVLNNNDLI